MSNEAFVTLAKNDGYALGALTLAESIRQVRTDRNLVVLVSNDLSNLFKKSLEKCFDEVIVVDQFNSNDREHLELSSRPELGSTFMKFRCWSLEQYSKCVFLDADCFVLHPIDDLFEREEFSAAPDAVWPDHFNFGVFVYQPSKETFNNLISLALKPNSSFDGGDQGFLNGFFSNWRTGDVSRHLPFKYNMNASAFCSFLPAIAKYRPDIRVVRFADLLKPWVFKYNPEGDELSCNLVDQSNIPWDFVLSWWKIMHRCVKPIIEPFNQEFSDRISLLNVGRHERVLYPSQSIRIDDGLLVLVIVDEVSNRVFVDTKLRLIIYYEGFTGQRSMILSKNVKCLPTSVEISQTFITKEIKDNKQANLFTRFSAEIQDIQTNNVVFISSRDHGVNSKNFNHLHIVTIKIFEQQNEGKSTTKK